MGLLNSGTTNIPTLIVAIYAAVVSTVTGLVQLLNYRRDRDKIKITVQKNMRIYGDPRYADKTLTIVKVVNAGRRPVTITSIGVECLFPNPHGVFPDTNPNLPYELTEGKYLVAQANQEGLDFSIIQCWFVCDALGRTHRLSAAPWHKRWVSNYRLKRKWKQEKKAATGS
jgi:hypothetical protein